MLQVHIQAHLHVHVNEQILVLVKRQRMREKEWVLCFGLDKVILMLKKNKKQHSFHLA